MSLKQLGEEFRVRLFNPSRKGGKVYQYAVYECDCGNIVIMRVVKARESVSCGCERSKSTIKRCTTHGLCHNKSYRVWSSMIQRCTNKNNKNYHHYGERGITVCDKWKNFEGFYEDMGDQPPKLTLDRVDNSKGYSKENCKWVSMTEQNRNTRKNRILTIDGVSKTLPEWCECEGAVNYHTAHSRFRMGWDHKDIVFKPVNKKT